MAVAQTTLQGWESIRQCLRGISSLCRTAIATTFQMKDAPTSPIYIYIYIYAYMIQIGL